MANNIATVTSVALPANLFSHIETRINDNSVRRYTRNTDGNFNFLAVGLTPKGEDGRVITIKNGIDEYDRRFGFGPYSIYGQSHLNSRYAAQTGLVTLQVLRLTADDAAYANVHIFANYRLVPVNAEEAEKPEGPPIEPDTPITNPDEGDEGGEEGGGGQGNNPGGDEEIELQADNTAMRLEVMYTAVSVPLGKSSDLVATAPSAEDIADALNLETDGGWSSMRFASFAYKGKGKCGNNIAIRIANHARADKSSKYKNYYFDVFEGTTLKEEDRVTLYPDAVTGSTSLYVENKVNTSDGTDGSDLILCDFNEEALPTLFALYDANVKPNLAEESLSRNLTELNFDPILGIDPLKVKAKSWNADDSQIFIDNFQIIGDGAQNAIQFNDPLGIRLAEGNDGAFDTTNDPVKRQQAIDAVYVKALTGEIDRAILSKYRVPLDYACDADFSYEVKEALAWLCTKRNEDFRAYFDLGTDLPTREAPIEDSKAYVDCISHWTMSIDGYAGKVKDPYNKKVINVTSTYHLAAALPIHWNKYGGKHVAYAGSSKAILDTYLPNTIYPIYDPNIDADIMNKLVDAHVNYATIDPKQNIIRGSQTSRYSGAENEQFEATEDYIVSNLSEENNGLIALDIKKDVEKLITDYAYDFNESAQINSFNRDLSMITDKYAAAQVRSIKANFARTEEEAELGVLHLYIELVNKPLIKYLQVDIDVNRSVSTD